MWLVNVLWYIPTHPRMFDCSHWCCVYLVVGKLRLVKCVCVILLSLALA